MSIVLEEEHFLIVVTVGERIKILLVSELPCKEECVVLSISIFNAYNYLSLFC